MGIAIKAMGNLCESKTVKPAEAKVSQDIHSNIVTLKDLPAPSTAGVTDQLRLFELSLPFTRIQVNQFIVKVKIACQQSGDEGYVTLQTLRAELKTPAWKDLDNEESTLSRFLLSSAFRCED